MKKRNWTSERFFPYLLFRILFFFFLYKGELFFHLYKETKGGLGQSIIKGCGLGFRIRALGNGSLKRFEGHEGFTDRPDLVVFQLGV